MKRQRTYLEELAEQMGPRTAIGRKVARRAARAAGEASKPKANGAAKPNGHDQAPAPSGKGLVVGQRAYERAAAMLAQSGNPQAMRVPEPFSVDLARMHPPGVIPADVKKRGMAMDADINAVAGWANSNFVPGSYGNAIQSTFWEGQEFLGFPYLAALAQRAEYRAITDTIATEAMRKGWKLEATGKDNNKDDRIKELNDYLDNDLGAREMFKAVSAQGGDFGRAHLFVDTGADTLDRDEMLTSIGNGRDKTSRLKIGRRTKLRLQTVEAVWCYPNNYNSNNPLAADWYRPQTWFSMGNEVHVTRLLPFVPYPVPDLLKPAYSFGGLSMTQMAKPYVDNWLRTRQAVADIVQAFSIMVLSSDLSASMGADGDQMFKRAVLFNAVKNNNMLMMVDKDSEEFSNVAAPLGTIDQIQAQSQEHMAAVSKIPTVKLLGIQPAGLNADSEGILRAFDDTIHSYQEHMFRPNLTTVVHMAMLARWGEVDPEITITFPRLREMDEKEAAEIGKIEAETDVILVDGGILHPEEPRKRIANQPDSPYQGIDPDDVPEPPAEPVEPGGPGGQPSEGGGALEPTKVKSSINVAGGDSREVADEGIIPFDAGPIGSEESDRSEARRIEMLAIAEEWLAAHGRL